MKKQNTLSLVVGLLLIVALAGAVILVGKNQETRRGAYFAGTRMLLQPEQIAKSIGDDVLVQLWADTQLLPGSTTEKAKIDFVQTMVCYGPGLTLDESNLTSQITVNSSAFTNVQMATVGTNPNPSGGMTKCLNVAISSDKQAVDLKSGMVQVATIKFRAVANGAGQIGILADKTTASGNNPNVSSTDMSLQIGQVTGSNYTIGSGTATPGPGSTVTIAPPQPSIRPRSCPESYNGWKSFVYEVAGVQKIRHAVIERDGKHELFRTCSINGEGNWVENTCSRWTDVDITNLIPVPPAPAGSQSYIASSAHTFMGVDNSAWLRQSYITFDGKTSWYRDCPSRADGEFDTSRCTAWKSVTIENSIPGSSGTYRGWKSFTYKTSDGVQHLRQGLLEMEGRYEWARTCSIDGNHNIITNSCDSWTKYDLGSLLPLRLSPGIQKWSESSAHSYVGGDGKKWLRQSYISWDGMMGWWRSCPSREDGNFDTAACLDWAPAPIGNLTGACPGITSTPTTVPTAVPTVVNNSCSNDSQCGFCGLVCKKIAPGSICPMLDRTSMPIPGDVDCRCVNNTCTEVKMTPTPTSSTTDGGIMNFKFNFGNLVADSNCVNNWKLQITVLGGGQTKIFTGVDTVKEGSSYKASINLGNFEARRNLAIFVKGPKHLQMKFAKDGQVGAYTAAGGLLDMSNGDKTFDFTGYPMLPGDVTGPVAENQDGVINGIDFSYVKAKSMTHETTSTGGYILSDLDGNCQVNTNDLNVLKISLSEKQGELY